MEANNIYPNETAPKEQSDLGPYCLQHRLATQENKLIREADEKYFKWRAERCMHYLYSS